MEFYKYTLTNGIRCIHKCAKSPVTHCALTINAGSRDELSGEEGVAHFTEHSLFKGTLRRRAHHINCRLEKLGGELNAFTTKEETVVHATTLKSDFAKAAELIADVAFHSTFPAAQIAMEKTVILDEINSYKDSPQERIWDDFEDLIFAGSPLGHNILGTRRSLSRQNERTIAGFVALSYNTDQMVFSSAGNLSERAFRAVVDHYFGSESASLRTFSREKPQINPAFTKEENHKTHQAHCIIGALAYDAYDNRRLALSLLTNLLGGPAANSVLNIALREKRGLTYNIEASYTPMSDTGLAAIYFSSEKDATTQCVEIIEAEIRKLRTEALSDRKLSTAKKQFLGQYAIAMESNEGAMLGAGKSFLMYNDVDGIDAVRKKIESVTAMQIMDAANEIFDKPSILTYR